MTRLLFRKDQMLIELDVDPFTVHSNKAIEARSLCGMTVTGAVQTAGVGGVGVGAICDPLTAMNDFRSGCIITQTMLLDMSTTQELALRKPSTWGNVNDAEILDSSIWAAFEGRRIRFLWQFD